MKKSVLFYFVILILLFGCQKQPEEVSGLESLTADLPTNMSKEVESQPETESKTEPEALTSYSVQVDPPKSILEKLIPFEKESEDLIGWLKINGTSIDAPLVKGPDNEHYLNHTYQNEPSKEGAIYADYRNQGDFKDRHMAIYGHYWRDGTMFHDLHFYKDQSFAHKHPIITLSSKYASKNYHIVSIQIVSANTYYLIIDHDAKSMSPYIDFLKSGSIFDINGMPFTNQNLLTLVTCTYEFDNARLLIHALELLPQPVKTLEAANQ